MLTVPPLLWAGNAVVGRLVSDLVPPLTLNFLRWLIAFCILLPMAGGVAASALIGLLSSFMFSGGVIFFVFVSICLSLIEQASDLLESKFKRIFGVKDSGDIIPGHGGVLDRLDGLMLAAPTVLFLITVFPSKFGG